MACFVFVEAFFMMMAVTFVVVRMTENGEFFQQKESQQSDQKGDEEAVWFDVHFKSFGQGMQQGRGQHHADRQADHQFDHFRQYRKRQQAANVMLIAPIANMASSAQMSAESIFNSFPMAFNRRIQKDPGAVGGATAPESDTLSEFADIPI